MCVRRSVSADRQPPIDLRLNRGTSQTHRHTGTANTLAMSQARYENKEVHRDPLSVDDLKVFITVLTRRRASVPLTDVHSTVLAHVMQVKVHILPISFTSVTSPRDTL